VQAAVGIERPRLAQVGGELRHGQDERVAEAAQGLDETRLARGVAEALAQSVDADAERIPLIGVFPVPDGLDDRRVAQRHLRVSHEEAQQQELARRHLARLAVDGDLMRDQVEPQPVALQVAERGAGGAVPADERCYRRYQPGLAGAGPRDHVRSRFEEPGVGVGAELGEYQDGCGRHAADGEGGPRGPVRRLAEDDDDMRLAHGGKPAGTVQIGGERGRPAVPSQGRGHRLGRGLEGGLGADQCGPGVNGGHLQVSGGQRTKRIVEARRAVHSDFLPRSTVTIRPGQAGIRPIVPCRRRSR
jgi:hypothetical protein